KFDGDVHNPPFRNIAIAMHEPVGTVGIICPREAPLLGFLSVVLPALAMGNTVIAVPSEAYPLIAGDLYQVFDTSDLPGGAVNIVTGYVSQLLKTLQAASLDRSQKSFHEIDSYAADKNLLHCERRRSCYGGGGGCVGFGAGLADAERAGGD